MNARQKAKKYKKLYENLLNQPVKFNVVTPKVDTLKFEQFYTKEFLDRCSVDFLTERLNNTMAENLAKSLSRYVRYTVEYGPDGNHVTGEIRIVPVVTRKED